MKKIEVVAAIIYSQEKILCVQRKPSNLSYISEKFEFPGGKIESNETQIEALRRELIEELEIHPIIEDFFLSVTHQYPDFELTMHTYKCRLSSRKLKLNEHISSQWLQTKDLISLDWAEADLPIVTKLVSSNESNN
jgi:8-oxo-dGTP diphosphatase